MDRQPGQLREIESRACSSTGTFFLPTSLSLCVIEKVSPLLPMSMSRPLRLGWTRTCAAQSPSDVPAGLPAHASPANQLPCSTHILDSLGVSVLRRSLRPARTNQSKHFIVPPLLSDPAPSPQNACSLPIHFLYCARSYPRCICSHVHAARHTENKLSVSFVYVPGGKVCLIPAFSPCPFIDKEHCPPSLLFSPFSCLLFLSHL